MNKRMSYWPWQWLILTTFIITISSCQKEEIITPEPKASITPEQEGLKSVILGEKLKNPYTVKNMKEAYDELIKASNGRTFSEELDIRTTHLYIRFLPKDSIEVDSLVSFDMELFDYPLDYEITEAGDFYHDPAIPQDQPTYKYGAVEADYEIPSFFEYELLAELYLPEEDEDTLASEDDRISPLNTMLEALEDQALLRTNNLSDTELNSDNSNARRRKWNPSGQILVENPISGTIRKNGRLYDGVPNVKARVRRWFTIRTSQTDARGYFRIGRRFKRDVNYGVKYTNGNAFIKPSIIGFGPAFLNGPKMKGHWEYRSHRGSNSYLWGAIMKGVYDYHYIWARHFMGHHLTGLKSKHVEVTAVG